MKKFVTLLALATSLFGARAGAQSFSCTAGDTVYVNATGTFTSHNNIHNLSGSGLIIEWKMIANTLPADWFATLGVCDNKLCYTGTDIWPTVLQESLTYGATAPSGPIGDFHILGDLSSTAGTGPYYVRIRINNKAIPTDTAIQTYIIGKGTANVPSVKTSDISLYPNPATSSVNVVYDAAADIKTLAIYSIIGKQVGVYRSTGNSANMSVENLPDGIYFVRLMNSHGDVVATKKFTKQ